MPTTTKVDRRALLHHAVAGAAAGAAVGLAAPTAIAAIPHDPLPALVDRYFQLVEDVNSGAEQDRIDRAFDYEEEVVQRIVDAVAPTGAGILAQLRLLRDIVEDVYWTDQRDERLLDSIEAGIRLLAGDAA